MTPTRSADMNESGPSREETVDEYVARVLAEAPPMSDQTYDYIAEALAPSIRACKAAQEAAAAIERSAAETWRNAELARLAIEQEIRVMTLEEVARITRMPLRHLADDCRANRLEHVHSGGRRGMTAEQVRRLLRVHTEAAHRVDQMDSMEVARELSRRNAARATRRSPR